MILLHLKITDARAGAAHCSLHLSYRVRVYIASLMAREWYEKMYGFSIKIQNIITPTRDMFSCDKAVLLIYKQMKKPSVYLHELPAMLEVPKLSP